MNRRQRRAAKRSGLTILPKDTRIPVFGPDNRAVALITPAELRWYEAAGNATIIKDRGGQVVQVILRNHSDDSNLVAHRGNPRRYSHDHETKQNPPRVWTIRRLAPHDTDADRFVQRVFRASVLDNLKEAA